jgi:enamine deaminase RidA (YjgF/YER057c/UK114 family)
MTAEQRLEELNIQLPDAPQPVAIYRPAVQVGNLLFVSGHGPTRVDGTQITGKVGVELTIEEAKEAARVTGLAILSTVRNTLGSLDRVVRVVKVLGMVNATPDFTEQPQVINGFSELMMEVFGDPGKGARSAVGMGSLPGNIPVEVEAIFEVE